MANLKERRKLLGFPVVAIVTADNNKVTLGSTLVDLRETLNAKILIVPTGEFDAKAVEISKDLGAGIIDRDLLSERSKLSEIFTESDFDPKYVVFTTSDFKYPAKYVLEMIQTMEDETSVGMVTGNRLNNHIVLAANHNNDNGRLAGLAKGILGVKKLNDPTTGLKVARWEVAKDWNLAGDEDVLFNRRVKDAGYRIVEFPISIRLPDPLDATVVIPTLNEERSISELLFSLRKAGFSHILVIDGNSKDKTVEIAKRYGVEVIYQNGRGKGAALVQAFGHKYLQGNLIVMMDADGSMNPDELPAFIEALEIGNDVVKGSRNLNGGGSEDMSLVRRIGNTFFVVLTNLLWSANYTDLCYGFAVFRKDAVRKLYPNLRSKNFEIETEIFVKAKKYGLRIAEVPSVELRRKHGKSNLKALEDGLRILLTIVREFLNQNGSAHASDD
jgi:GT2 family glycosyltransferase